MANIGFKRILSIKNLHQTKLICFIGLNKRHQSTSPASKPAENYDIVICGGGIVGTAMARALGKESVFKDLKIALIEPSFKSNNEYIQPIVHSNRICALNEKTIEFFKCKFCVLKSFPSLNVIF